MFFMREKSLQCCWRLFYYKSTADDFIDDGFSEIDRLKKIVRVDFISKSCHVTKNRFIDVFLHCTVSSTTKVSDDDVILQIHVELKGNVLVCELFRIWENFYPQASKKVRKKRWLFNSRSFSLTCFKKKITHL